MARALVTLPKVAKAGEVIEIRTLIQHAMETGYRRDSDGAMLPRSLIRRFTCHFAASGKAGPGDLVFATTLHAAMAANPSLQFHFRASSTGSFTFAWDGDDGFAHREQAQLLVNA